MSWQRFKVNVPKNLSPIQREALAQEVIDFVIERSKSGIDKNGNPFPAYSESYVKSLDFKIAGKAKGRVNLTLSEEMLQSLSLLSHRPGEILIGYDKSNKELNGKVEGNVLGTYGKSTPIKGKARDFMGIARKDLESILDKVESKKDAEKILKQRQATGELASGIEFEETD
jgi:hypothetical protein